MDVPSLLAEITQLRLEAGRAHLPFEAVVAVAAPPSAETFRHLGDLGVKTAISYPFRLALKEHSTLDEKKRHMDHFAETIMRNCR
jgi:hypothetical protein